MTSRTVQGSYLTNLLALLLAVAAPALAATCIADGLIIVQGNGGDLVVLRHSGR